MLDLDHPQSRHVLAAAHLEGEIQARLLAWRESAAAGGLARQEILRTWLPQLEALNAEHFGASKKIHRTLDTLGRVVQGDDAEAAWQAFHRLLGGPGDNFGTWGI
jgi:hypothetical protein